MPNGRLLVVSALASTALGCATSLTNLSDPHALEPGRFEVTLAGQASASSVLLDKSRTGLRALVDPAEPGAPASGVSSVDPDLVDGALAWALFWPGVDPELMLRGGLPSGPLPGLDAGLRLSPAVVRLDAKAQLFESASGLHAVALQLGYGWHHGGPHKSVEWLTLVEFGRHDVEAMATWGFGRPDLVEGYLGPRVLLSYITVKPRLGAELVDALPREMRQFNPAHLFEDSWIAQAGASAGVKVGYRFVFLRLELNTLYMWFRPVVLGRQRQFDGLVLAPSAALSASW